MGGGVWSISCGCVYTLPLYRFASITHSTCFAVAPQTLSLFAVLVLIASVPFRPLNHRPHPDPHDPYSEASPCPSPALFPRTKRCRSWWELCRHTASRQTLLRTWTSTGPPSLGTSHSMPPAWPHLQVSTSEPIIDPATPRLLLARHHYHYPWIDVCPLLGHLGYVACTTLHSGWSSLKRGSIGCCRWVHPCRAVQGVGPASTDTGFHRHCTPEC